MRITILTLFPAMFRGFLNESIVKRAQEQDQIEIELVNFRDYANDKHKTVDQQPYGGGVGMVLMVEPIVNALRDVQKKETGATYTILTSARGNQYTQQKAYQFSHLDHLVIICGHYEGCDERLLDYIDEEVSIGDFVLTGGEIVAAAITDSIARLIPSVLKHEEATTEESFFKVPLDELFEALGSENPVLQRVKKRGVRSVTLLEYPHYTRPEEFEGKRVPDILLSGHHHNIRQWRLQQAFKRTCQQRPDLLDK